MLASKVGKQWAASEVERQAKIELERPADLDKFRVGRKPEARPIGLPTTAISNAAIGQHDYDDCDDDEEDE